MIAISIGLPMPILVYLEHLQPAVSEYLLQPEEPQLHQRKRSLEKLYVPYQSELTTCPDPPGVPPLSQLNFSLHPGQNFFSRVHPGLCINAQYRAGIAGSPLRLNHAHTFRAGRDLSLQDGL